MERKIPPTCTDTFSLRLCCHELSYIHACLQVMNNRNKKPERKREVQGVMEVFGRVPSECRIMEVCGAQHC